MAERDALHIGAHLLEKAFRGKYLAVLREGHDVGFAVVRRLTLTRSHANVISGNEQLKFERHTDEEHSYVVFKPD